MKWNKWCGELVCGGQYGTYFIWNVCWMKYKLVVIWWIELGNAWKPQCVFGLKTSGIVKGWTLCPHWKTANCCGPLVLISWGISSSPFNFESVSISMINTQFRSPSVLITHRQHTMMVINMSLIFLFWDIIPLINEYLNRLLKGKSCDDDVGLGLIRGKGMCIVE